MRVVLRGDDGARQPFEFFEVHKVAEYRHGYDDAYCEPITTPEDQAAADEGEHVMEHVCDLASPLPLGHPLPPVIEGKLTGPVPGSLAIITSKYKSGLVVRVLEQSYVWSPGECRHKGGYRRYDWSVITDDHGYQVVVDDKDLLPIEPGLNVTLLSEQDLV